MALVSLSSYSEEYARSIQLPKCNRDACNEKFAPCFNIGTKTYYCIRCARDINFAPLPGTNQYLCEIPEFDEKLADMEAACYEGKQYVGTRMLKDVPELLNTGYTAQPSRETSAVREELTGQPGDLWEKESLVNTGFRELDRRGGFRRGEMVVIGSPVGIGKSMIRHFLNVIDGNGQHKIFSVGQAMYRKIVDVAKQAERMRAEEEAIWRKIKRDQRRAFNKRKKQARARTGRR